MMTLREAAALLGVAHSTLRWQIRNGKLAATKLAPRLWVVDEDEVERYRRENRRAA